MSIDLLAGSKDMDREIQRADFVSMVCTETYLRRVEGRSAAKHPGWNSTGYFTV
jgi:hypothetical protein